MKRKTISIIAALALCAALLALPVSASENTLSKEAKLAFGSFIKTVPEASSFATVDMNADGKAEVLVESSYEGGGTFLLYFNGTSVDSYQFGIREMNNNKADGSYMGSNGASDTYFLRFKAGTTNFKEEDKLAYSEMIEDSVHYFIDNKEVSESSFDKWCSEWGAREDFKWLEFNSENIKAAFLSDNQ
jgi:hypothetical protein